MTGVDSRKTFEGVFDCRSLLQSSFVDNSSSNVPIGLDAGSVEGLCPTVDEYVDKNQCTDFQAVGSLVHLHAGSPPWPAIGRRVLQGLACHNLLSSQFLSKLKCLGTGLDHEQCEMKGIIFSNPPPSAESPVNGDSYAEDSRY